ncbi:MAG: carboxypeptidase regulatory-like domain-containing protein, partial [Planctomycetes bacterium]|nr:carboxypeptidase regulatory-like domain-containing protein [Planctomycetota bacterium]
MAESAAIPDPERLLERFEGVRHLVRNLVHDADLADELEQRTRIATWSTPPPDPSGLRSWVRTVGGNFLRREHRAARARRRHERAAARSERRDARDLVELAETQRFVVDAVLHLAEPYRSTVLQRYFEDVSVATIATREGVSVSAIRMRCKRALELLRDRLAPLDEGEQRRWAPVFLWIASAGSSLSPPSAPIVRGVGRLAAPATVGGSWMVSKMVAVAVVSVAMLWGVWALRSPATPPDRRVSSGSSADVSSHAHTDPEGSNPREAASAADKENPSSSVRGVVVDAFDGHPIAGAIVELSPDTSSPRFEPSTRSDARGSFEIPIPGSADGHPWQVRASAEGFEPARVRGILAATDHSVRVELGAGVEVAGRVSTSLGRPATSGTVHPVVDLVCEAGAPTRGRPETWRAVPIQRDGTFRLYLSASEVTLVARVPDHTMAVTDPLVLTRDGLRGLELVVAPAPARRLRVVDESSRPIAGARIRCVPVLEDRAGPTSTGADFVEGATDDAGDWIAPFGATILRSVSISHPDFLDHSILEPVSLAIDPTEIALSRGLRFSGTIDPPLEESEVLTARASAMTRQRCTVDSEGRFATPVIDPLATRLELERDGYLPIPWDLPAPTAMDPASVEDPIDLGLVVFERGSEFRVTVRDDQARAVMGARLALGPTSLLDLDAARASRRSDAEGIASFSGMPSGSYSLTVEADGYSFRPVHVSLPTAETKEVVLTPTASLLARVTDEAGRPILGARAAVRRHRTPKGRSDGDGRVRWQEVPAGTAIEVELSHRGYVPMVQAIDPLHGGEARDLGTIVLSRGPLVRGRIVDPEGRPIAGALVSASQRYGSKSTWVETDDRGEFALGGLPAEPFRLAAQADGFGVTERRWDGPPGDEMVEIILEPAGERIVRFGRSGGAPIRCARLLVGSRSSVFELFTDVDGRAVLPAAFEGACDLSLHQGDRQLFGARYASYAEIPESIELPATAALRLLFEDPLLTAKLSYELRDEATHRGPKVASGEARIVDGRALVEDLPCGRFRLRLDVEGLQIEPRTIELAPD